MPVTISKTVHIKDKEGNISILTETDQIAESTDIFAVCDSSRCASRHDGKAVQIAWNIEAVREKHDALPDSFFRLLTLIVDPKTQKQLVFCSAGCLKDFITYDYVAPLSPREEAEFLARNQQAEIEKHRPKTNIIQFPAPRSLNPPAEPITTPKTSEIGPEELGAAPQISENDENCNTGDPKTAVDLYAAALPEVLPTRDGV